jgi:hypothetical protein
MGILDVTMHFSNVVGLAKRDLLLRFTEVIGLRWNPEDLGSVFHPLTIPLPKLTDPTWDDWTFPLLEVIESKWLAIYADYPGTGGRKHYELVAMNDLLGVLASPDVVATWHDV